MWLAYVVAGLGSWVLLATVAGVVLGRSIRLADERELGRSPLEPSGDQVVGRIRPARPRVRRRSPVPPVAGALAGLAVAAETTGYLVRLLDAPAPWSRLLSMDAPGSLPRILVVTLFATAGAFGFSGTRIPGRRAWWGAVGAVGVGIATVKASGDLHARVSSGLDDRFGASGAALASAVAAASVVGGLWWLSRRERRDRRRVLGALAGYAVAAVGLSAVSGVASVEWAATATFVEEAGEALAGVAFLVAVLVGVAPRLVLPADWALRRRADEHTLAREQSGSGRLDTV